MRNLLLIVLSMTLSFSSYSQPWTKNLPKNKTAKELTLRDYQKAFNQYWKQFDVKNGYYINEKGVKTKAPGWKQFNRWEWNMEPQVDAKTGRFPQRSVFSIMKEWNKSHKTQKSKAANWVSLGPNGSDGGYAGVGRINNIGFHPTDNNTYWICAPAGGLWKTTDDGQTWTCLTDNNGVLGVSEVIVPSDYDSSHTLYIATGDREVGDNKSIGVLKSTDDGQTWQTTGLSFELGDQQLVTRILLDPNDNQTLVASTSAGVYKTTDGATTWTKLSNYSFIDIEYQPNNFDVIYGSNRNGQVYATYDGGASWQNILTASAARTELAVTPADSTIVYALVSGYDYGLYAIYKSTNSGASFDKILDGTQSGNNLLDWYDGYGDGGQGFYDLSLAISPVDTNKLVLGGVNSWRSDDGGLTWTMSSHWYGGSYAQAVHADKHMQRYRANGDLFECNDGGVYISQNNGVSGTWEDRTNGITNSQMYKLGVAQSVPNETITGLQDNGTKLNSSGNWTDVKGGDGMECLIDYTNNNIQYGTYVRGQISKTTNHWNSSSEIQPNDAGSGAWVTPYIIDLNDPATLYAGYADVWKTTDRGESWSKVSTFNTSQKIRSMAISASNSNYVYAADFDHIWKSENAGGSWSDISSNLPSNSITYIAVKNDDPNTIWVTLGDYDSNAVYESTNGGQSWTNISAGLPPIPAYTIVQNKIEPTVNLYVGTEVGVYLKKGTDNWILFNNGLPNVKVGELEIYYDENNIDNSKIRVATYGRGLWESNLELSGTYPPTLSVSAAQSVSTSSAVLSGEILNDFASDVTESGFVYSLDVNPELGATNTMSVQTSPVVTSGQFSATLSGLNSGSRYYFRAYAKSGNGVGYSDELNFGTLCDVVSSFPYVETFKDFSKPVCWSIVDNYGNNQVWKFDNPGNIVFNSTTASNGFAMLNSRVYGVSGSQDADLISSTFDFSTSSAVNLKFEHYFRQFPNNSVKLQYSVDGGTNWVTLDSWNKTTANATTYDHNITGFVAGQSNVTFRWKYEGTYGYYWAVDDVEITTDVSPEYRTTFNVTKSNGGAPVSNATIDINGTTLTTNSNGVVYTELPNGTYNYTIQAADFNDVSGSVDITDVNKTVNVTLDMVGISNISENNIKVYPNPAHEVLHINSLSNVLVSITTVDGKEVYKGNITGEKSINLKEFEVGTYFIKLTSDTNSIIKKLVIK